MGANLIALGIFGAGCFILGMMIMLSILVNGDQPTSTRREREKE